jgi:P4 family phage/plasmid primase-like protien
MGLLKHFAGRQTNVGVLLGEPSGWLIDIDLDHPRAVELAAQFLPSTPAVSGRPGKPRSHWWYRVTAPVQTHKRPQTQLGMIVELRSTGGQTVIPPSVHPSGEATDWDAATTIGDIPLPADVDPEILIKAVDSLADAVCLAEGVDPKKTAAPEKAGRRKRNRRQMISVAERARRYLAAMPPAISGQGGHNQTFDAACSLVLGFALSVAEATPLLAEYNQQCQPPWSDHELLHKLESADEKSGERGYLLTKEQESIAASLSEVADQVLPESIDDPHRLARMNLEQYASSNEGRTLRFWRDEWYVWKRNKYRKISEPEFRAKLAMSIKQEYDRAYRAGETDEVRKVTGGLISNVMLATSGYVNLSAEVEFGTWLDDRSRRPYVSMTNGILDIDAVLAGKPEDQCLLPHSPKWFSLVSVPYAFDSDAGAEPKLWLGYLDRVLESDQERIAILQEWAGYLLLPETGQQKFLVCEGDGANGKSVYGAVMTALLGGENVSNIQLEVFGDRFSRTETLGKLANICGDVGEIDKVSEGYVKSFTSGDRMFFDRKGVSGLNVVPTARLMLACNHRPRFSDRSDGVWRRMIPMPFRVQIQESEKVIGMDKAEWWEASGEMPAIFNWALLGLARLRQQGRFTRSRIVDEARESYREEMNPARMFLKEFLEESRSGLLPSKVLYKVYTDWIHENGYRPLSEKQFGREVFRCFPKCNRVQRGSKFERTWCYEFLQFSVEEVSGNKVNDSMMF